MTFICQSYLGSVQSAAFPIQLLSRAMRKDDDNDDGMSPIYYSVVAMQFPADDSCCRWKWHYMTSMYDQDVPLTTKISTCHVPFDVISIRGSRWSIATQRPQREPRGISRLCFFLSFQPSAAIARTRARTHTHTPTHTGRILVSTETARGGGRKRFKARPKIPVRKRLMPSILTQQPIHDMPIDICPDASNLLDGCPAARPFLPRPQSALCIFQLRSFTVEPLFNYIVMDETLAVGHSRHYRHRNILGFSSG